MVPQFQSLFCTTPGSTIHTIATEMAAAFLLLYSRGAIYIACNENSFWELLVNGLVSGRPHGLNNPYFLSPPGPLQQAQLYFILGVMCAVLNHFSHVWLSVTPWTVACHAPLSMGFSRQEYWSGLPCPPPGDLSNPGMELCLWCLLHWQAGPLPIAPPGKPTIYLEWGFWI